MTKHITRIIDSTEPVIDLSDLSLEDTIKMNLLEANFIRMEMLQKRAAGKDVSEKVLDELLDAINPDKLRETFDGNYTMMAKVVKFVPADWFTPRAPAEKDWADPELYRNLRADKARQLMQLIRLAQQPDEIAKNSEGSSS